MCQTFLSLAVVILAMLPITKPSMLNDRPQFILEAEGNKEFNESYLIETFEIRSGKISECLKHCLESCSCQSFQICQNTVCQLCSSNKEDDSSLLQDKNGCVYAVYKVQKIVDQCSGISCPIKYNCCQQSGLCPKNKICKPVYNLTQPWKRFVCECPVGYHGNNCDKPITSCQGYSNGSRTSGIYKVLDSNQLVYDVYYHFDEYGAWTLLQSYSFENRVLDEFSKDFTLNFPLNEDILTWSGYRLSKARMQSIKDNSVFLRFTCDYEKHQEVIRSDYIDTSSSCVSIRESNRKIWDEINVSRGKIGGAKLNGNCRFSLEQWSSNPHLVFEYRSASDCAVIPSTGTPCKYFRYFGGYDFVDATNCRDELHSCLSNNESTTQLWFGN